MGVVIDIGHAVARAAELETAPHAGISRQRLPGHVWLYADLGRGGQSGDGVTHVVQARDGELEAAQGPAALRNIEVCPTRRQFRPDDAESRPGGRPVRGHPGYGRGQSCRPGVVEADYPRPRRLLHKGLEGAGQGLLAPVVVEMVRLHVGDHGSFRPQAQKGAVGLVRLDHQPRPPAPGRAALGSPHLAPHHVTRCQARSHQDPGQHRRGRGLAVRAADRQRPPGAADGA